MNAHAHDHAPHANGVSHGSRTPGRAPGPRGYERLELLGAVTRGTLPAYLLTLAQRYGPVAAVDCGPLRAVAVAEPAIVEEILVTRQHEFVRDTGATLLRELVGEGLLTTEDPAHVERRRLLQPAFHRARIASYGAAVAAEAERAAGALAGRPLVDVGAEMTRYALGAVGAALFGDGLRAEADAVAGILASVLARGTSVLGAIAVFGAPALRWLHRVMPERESFLFPDERAQLDAIVAPLIARSRRDGAQGHDLLSQLVAMHGDGKLDDRAIRNELVTLVLAGHETTANLLTWAWYLLARYPLAETTLHRELDRVLGDRPPTYDDVPKLAYAARIIDETLRMYPPAAAFARRPLRDTVLGGYAVPAMTSVFLSPYVLGRDPRFFEEPSSFRPDRWEAPQHPRFAYFPFGGGSKTCIGEPLARLEAVLGIAAIARRYRLQLVDDVRIDPSGRALLRPESPVLATAVPRERVVETISLL